MYSKKKDKNPIATVSKIRTILEGLDIIATESWTKHFNPAFSTFYSLKLSVFGILMCSVAGKNTSIEYALASAYGELIERIQTGIWLRLLPAFKMKQVLTEPESSEFSKEKMKKLNNHFIERDFLTFIKKSFINNEVQKLMTKEEVINFCFEHIDNQSIIVSPYYSLREGKSILLPHSIIRELQGSNGMCAGNTKEEALVQGFSEVFERASVIEILNNKLTPPTIDKEIYEKYEDIKRLIDYLEELGFTVEVKDCSLGKKYPVVATNIFHKDSKKYLVSFGAHPSLPIAIERCLTEAAQGINFEDKKSFFEHMSCAREKKAESFNKENFVINIENHLRFGCGIFPDEYFSADPSWEVDTSIWLDESLSNKELMLNLAKRCLEYSKDIYIKDYSFLGFPTFQIVIPELSAIPYNYKLYKYQKHNVSNEEIFEKYKTQEGTKEIYEAAMAFHLTKYQRPENIFFRQVNDIFVLIACCIRLNRTEEAMFFIDKFLIDEEKTSEKETIQELKCLKDMLVAKQLSDDNREVINTLKNNHSEEIISHILKKWFSENTLEGLCKGAKKIAKGREKHSEYYKAEEALSKLNAALKRIQSKSTYNFPCQDSINKIISMKDIYNI